MSTIDDPRVARAVLARLTIVGDRLVHTMIHEEGPEAVLRRLIAGHLPQAEARSAATEKLGAAGLRQVATRIIADTERIGARIVIPQDAEWPTAFEDLNQPSDGDARLPAPPPCLWVRGAQPLGDTLHRSVAVIGARAATSYGQHVAAELGHGLAESGWTIFNTGGYGVDAAALRGALTAGHLPVAVNPAGLDRPHPQGNSALFERVSLISAWPPGSAPCRSRISVNGAFLAAMTGGCVLVEAALRSGARTVLAQADAFGRPVMAVPGPVTSALSAGCHQVLRETPRVRLVRDVADVIGHLTERRPPEGTTT
ncbi:DNA-processing protein DprA [Micromonospora ureilytica]|uniref:DNA-processing protein DprA n=1 Tax=Micromonospora ureilytica TaxID=709868 RepID=UPI0040395B43